MPNRLKIYLKKKMTFMVVPHDGGKSMQIKVNLFALHALLLLFGALVAWAALVIARDVNYQLAQLTEQRFRNNMREIMDELETNRILLSRMASVDFQFRKLLKLGNRKEVFELNGMGGPTEEDSARFSRLLQEKNEHLLNKVDSSLKLSNQQADRKSVV